MKDNVFEDFEDYIQNRLNNDDKYEFDKRLEEDTAFASSFAIYKEIEEQMRMSLEYESNEEELVSTLKNLNRKYVTDGSAKSKMSVFTKHIVQWSSGIAAGIGLYFIVSALFFGGGPDAQQMANEYFADNFSKLGQSMDGAGDSLQLGIVAYNIQDYQVAQAIFEDVLLRDPLNSEAEKNLGLTHLAKEDYDIALDYFEKLASRDLHVNQGKFFQAMVLLKRGDSEDIYLAEILLNEVVNMQLAGYSEANKWLESL